MDNAVTPTNPYRPLAEDDVMLAPFAGRQRAYEFLYGRLTDPAHPQTTLVIGRRDVGKTALLRHFDDFFDEAFIGVYLPLRTSTPDPFPIGGEGEQAFLSSEGEWLRALAAGVTRALAERNFTLSRLPELDEQNLTREVFEINFLPEVFSIIRRQRRLIYLLDDADGLIAAVEAGRLPGDTFATLRRWVEAYSQLGIALTLDARYEADLNKLSPLAALEGIFRLDNLSSEDTAWLLNAPVEGRYSVRPAAAAQAATGGQPRLVQRLGYLLFEYQENNPGQTVLTTEVVKQVSPLVYAQSEADFKAAWGETTRNERLILTAIGSRLYADPLRPITPEAVEAWLIETDYPLDSTAIHAAIRGLEYREMVESAAGGLRLTTGLMQTWLLDNARQIGVAAAMAGGQPKPDLRWLAVAILAALVIVLVVIAGGRGASGGAAAVTAPPTVTLVGNP